MFYCFQCTTLGVHLLNLFLSILFDAVVNGIVNSSTIFCGGRAVDFISQDLAKSS